jgi:hypothetical protein
VETIIADGPRQIDVPAWVRDSESFRRWMHSTAFPEEGKICFIHGKVWVDLSTEEFHSHNAVRTEIGRALANLMKQTKFGQFVSEGMRYGHLETDLSTEPDGMSFRTRRYATGGYGWWAARRGCTRRWSVRRKSSSRS